MNVLIYTQSYFVRNLFLNALYPNGINLFHAEHTESIVNFIKQRQIEIVVIDVIQEDYVKTFTIMNEIKNNPDNDVKKVAIILLIGNVDKQNLIKAIQLGAVGFIKSNAKEETIYNYIIEIYKKTTGVPPERKYVRVTLNTDNPNDRIGIKFRSPKTLNIILGVIRDISFGGVAVELVGTFPPESIEVGMEVNNMQFILDGHDLFVNGVVVAYKKNFCAFRFVNLTQSDKEIICQFIFQRISSEIHKNTPQKSETDNNEINQQNNQS